MHTCTMQCTNIATYCHSSDRTAETPGVMLMTHAALGSSSQQPRHAHSWALLRYAGGQVPHLSSLRRPRHSSRPAMPACTAVLPQPSSFFWYFLWVL